MSTSGESQSIVLSRGECTSLLASASIGHLGITRSALPLVVPVRLNVVRNGVEIETLTPEVSIPSTGSVAALTAGTRGSGGEFEWSVDVCGVLRGLTVDSPKGPSRRWNEPGQTFR